MLFNIKKILFLFIITVFILLAFSGPALAYRVYGVVDFTVRSYDTKTGDSRTSTFYWTQNYQANLAGTVWDPRFLQFNAGLGYQIYDADTGSDSDSLNYRLSTIFFPGRRASWQLYANKITTTVDGIGDSGTSIAGYDIDTTTYGGILNLHLSSLGRNGNNNNYRNNNNSNNYYRYRFPLPDITLSHMHTESESLSEYNPYHETRDNTSAQFSFSKNSSFDLKVGGELEDYEDTISGSSYSQKTAQMDSKITISKDDSLTLTGRFTDRLTENMTDFDTRYKTQNYSGLLKFREKERVHHYYKYDYRAEETDSLDYTAHNLTGAVVYKINAELEARLGADFNALDYESVDEDTGNQSSNLLAAGLLAGVSYSKQYKPDFLKAFFFKGGYDFVSGFEDYTDNISPEKSGSGLYYTNKLAFGIRSLGWARETLGFDYTFANKRDNSPLDNNAKSQALSLSFSSVRFPKTTINANVNYSSRRNTGDEGGAFLLGYSYSNAGFSQNERYYSYNFSVNHRFTNYFNATAGTTRGDTQSNLYTLSTLSTPSSTSSTSSMTTAEYIEATFHYPLTRRLITHFTARDEYRTTEDSVGEVSRSQARYATVNLAYRIRAVFINMEYRWRQDIPDDDARTLQQYFYAKLSRPF